MSRVLLTAESGADIPPGLDEALRQAAEGTARACGVRQLHWVKTGGVITTHGGPGAFGVAGFAAGPAVS